MSTKMSCTSSLSFGFALARNVATTDVRNTSASPSSTSLSKSPLALQRRQLDRVLLPRVLRDVRRAGHLGQHQPELHFFLFQQFRRAGEVHLGAHRDPVPVQRLIISKVELADD